MSRPGDTEEILRHLGMRARVVGEGTLVYRWGHLEGSEAEGVFHLVFYGAVHFLYATGPEMCSRFFG